MRVCVYVCVPALRDTFLLIPLRQFTGSLPSYFHPSLR